MAFSQMSMVSSTLSMPTARRLPVGQLSQISRQDSPPWLAVAAFDVLISLTARVERWDAQPWLRGQLYNSTNST